MEKNKIYNVDCTEFITTIPDNSVNVILTDPPYLYLKNQKWDAKFDEQKLFSEARRILKPDGFIVLFGRGSSFYKWNNILAFDPFIGSGSTALAARNLNRNFIGCEIDKDFYNACTNRIKQM